MYALKQIKWGGGGFNSVDFHDTQYLNSIIYTKLQ